MASSSGIMVHGRGFRLVVSIAVGAVVAAVCLAHLVDLRRAGATVETISLSGPDTLGRGLQDVYTVVLSDPSPSPDGLQVPLSVSDATSCALAATESAAGQASLLLTVSPGSRRVTFVVQSLPGGSGSSCQVSIGVTTPAGWTGDPLSVAIVQGKLHLRELVHSVKSTAPDQPFFVEAGVAAGSGRRLRFVQGVSGGTPLVTVTACSDQAAIGTIANRFGQDVPPAGCEDNPILPSFSRTVPGDFQFAPIAGQSGTVTVTASAPGFISDQRSVDVRASSVSLHGPELLGAGLQDRYGVTLSDAAPADQAVSVSVADPSRCVVSLTDQGLGNSGVTVTVPSGRYRAEFVVQGVAAPVLPDTSPCTVTASAGTFGTDALDIDVVQPGLRIRDLAGGTSPFAPDDPFFVELGVQGPRDALSFVQMWRAGTSPTANGPLSVTAQSDAPGVGTIVNATGVDVGNDGQESDNVFPGFSRTVPGDLQFDPITGSATPVAVTATAPGFLSDEQDVTVQEATVLIAGQKELGSGLQDDYTVRLSDSTGHPATAVTVTSQNPAVCLVGVLPGVPPVGAQITINVAADDVSAPFVIQAVSEVAPTTCVIQAAASGYASAPFTLDVVRGGIRIRELNRNIPSDGNNDPFYVEVGAPNTNNTDLKKLQRWGVGGGDLPIKVCSSQPNFGTIVKQAVDNPPASDDPPGQGCEDDIIRQGFRQNVPGNLAFDPISPGSTLVTAYADGFVPMDRTGRVEVHVGGAAIVLNPPNKIGANLQDTAGFRLTQPAGSNGVTVSITSLTPSVCGVAPDAGTAAGGSVNVVVPAGGDNASFEVAGFAVGSCQLSATATGYLEDDQGLDVVAAALEIVGLDPSTGTTAPDASFTVVIGVPIGGDRVAAEAVRIGGVAVPVTVCSSNGAVGTIVGAGPNGCLTQTINVGQSQVTFVFHVVATIAGNTKITVNGGGATDTEVVHVAPTVVNVRRGAAPLGKDLQATFFAVANNNSGVTVTVNAAPSNVCVTSTDPTVPGDSTDKTLTIAPGTTRASFVVQALDVGTCTLTVSGNGIPTVSRDVDVVYARVRVSGLGSTIGFLAPNDSFTVEIGPQNLNIKDVQTNHDNRYGITQALARRAGAAPLSILVCSSNPAVGLISNGSSAQACQTIAIVAVSSNAPLQFDPLSGGNTDVTATPAQADVDDTKFTVTVKGGAVSLDSPDTIGNYLEAAAGAVFSPAPPSGTTVTVTASGACGVSAAPDGCPGSTLPLSVPVGRSRVDFWIQGLSVGTCTISMTTNQPGFATNAVDLDVTSPSGRIRYLDKTESSAAKNDPFVVDVGVASDNLQTLARVEQVRANCPAYPLPVTDAIAGLPLKVCSSNTAVGTIAGGLPDGTNCSRKVVPPGQSSTPPQAASNAYQFDPVGQGSTTVYVDPAGTPPVPLIPINAGSLAVTVVASTVSITPTNDIAAGLQDDYQVLLSTSAAAAGTATVTSLTPSVCTVAVLEAGPFGVSATVPIASGHSRADFEVQALTAGACVLHPTVNIPNATYTPVDRTVNAVGFSSHIVNLDTTRSTQSPNDPFNVEVGIANERLTDLAQTQDARTGGGGVPVKVCAINPVAPPQVAAIVGAGSDGCKTVTILERAHRTNENDLILDVMNTGVVTICSIPPVPVTRSCIDVNVAADVATIRGPDTVGAGLQEQYTLSLSSAVQSDTTFTVSNTNSSSVCKLALTAGSSGSDSIQVVVPAGRTSATFFVDGVDNVAGTCEVSATTVAAGVTGATRDIAVQFFSAQIINLDTTRSTQSPSDPFNAQIGVADTRLVGLGDVQSARGDEAGVPLSVCAAPGVLVGADASGCVAVVVPAGQNKTPDGALAFGANTSGTFPVCVSSPIPVRNSCKEVTVAATVATINGPDTIGAGLQDQFTLVLSSAVATPTAFTIATQTSSFDTSGICTVAPNATTAGAPSITVTVPQNSSRATFYLHGLDGANDTCKIAATTTNPSITGGYQEVQVAPYAAAIINLASTASTQSANDPFNVEIGVPSSGLTSIANEEPARSDGAGIALTVCAINPPQTTVGTLVGADANGCVAVTVAAGQSRTANGALTLDVLNPGTVTVCTSSPAPIRNSCRDVVVAADVATISGPSAVGASLEDQFSLTLTKAVQNDTTFTIASATSAFDTSAFCKVSVNETDVAQSSITVTVLSGRTRSTFWLHGMDGVTGTCQLLASTTSPGITAGEQDIPIVTPGVAISSLAGTIKTSSANDPFVVQTGVPSGNLRGLSIVQERRAGAGALTITACSSNTTFAQIAGSSGTGQCSTAPIGANSSETGSTALALVPLSGGTTTVGASAIGFISTAAAFKDVTVAQSTISLTAASGQTAIGAGLQDTFNIQLSPSAPSGGLPVTLTSLTPSVCLVAPNETTAGTTTLSFTIAGGHSLQHYAIQALEGASGEVCSVTITTTNTTYTGDEFDIAIVEPAVRIRGLDPTTTVAAANDPFNIDVGVPKDNLTDLRIVQTIRAGAPSALTVIACSSNTTIGTVTGTATSDPNCSSATITGGNSATANSALQFNPITAGSTTVVASAAGYLTTTAGSVDVVVAPAALSFAHATIYQVGAGLMDTFTVKSSAAVGSNTTVTITSLTPSVCLVATSETTASAVSAAVVISSGHSSTTFTIHGLENVTGACSLQATAPSFATGYGTYDITYGAVRIRGLSTSKSVGASDDAFNVDVGIANATLSGLQTTQKVRIGSTGVVVSVCSSNSAVGSIVGPSGPAPCANTTIAAGSYTDSSLKFHTGTGGITTVAATVPSYITTDAGSVDVTVSGAGASLTIKSSATQIGGGLQDGSFYAQAGAIPASAVTVTVTSLTPSACLVSASGSTVGGASTTVTIPTTSTNSNAFWVQALEGVVGTCSLQATATFYGNGSGSVDIVTPAIRLRNVPTSIAATAANVTFNVDIGVPLSDLSDLSMAQPVRAGSAGFSVTVNNVTASVAQLTSSIPPSPAQTVMTVIPAQSSTTTDAGLQFDPIAAGGTSVTATNPSALATTAATVAVAVTSGGGC